jgi:hypothetical protein
MSCDWGGRESRMKSGNKIVDERWMKKSLNAQKMTEGC